MENMTKQELIQALLLLRKSNQKLEVSIQAKDEDIAKKDECIAKKEEDVAR